MFVSDEKPDNAIQRGIRLGKLGLSLTFSLFPGPSWVCITCCTSLAPKSTPRLFGGESERWTNYSRRLNTIDQAFFELNADDSILKKTRGGIQVDQNSFFKSPD